jgi:hypothetical protein
MTKFIYSALLIFSANVFAGPIAVQEIDLAKEQAVRELILDQKIHAHELSKQGQFPFIKVHVSDRDCNDGAGSAACWKACSREGFGSGTCAGRCGVTTELGSVACWNACSKEGFGSGTCSSRCGTQTPGGSAACWEACSKEGFGSATCSSRCGTN